VARTGTKKHLQLHFRVRPFLVRWLVSALTLAVTVILVPHVYFSGAFPVLSYLLISGVFGLLNAFIKPLFQLLLLPLIFVSYGLVIVVINTLILWMLSGIFPNRFHVEHVLWAIVAGVVSGLIYTLLENVFGLSPPIIQTAPPNVQEEIAESKGLVESGILKATGHGATAPIAAPEDLQVATLQPAAAEPVAAVPPADGAEGAAADTETAP
jgi:putative membrane protein